MSGVAAGAALLVASSLMWLMVEAYRYAEASSLALQLHLPLAP